MPVKEFEEVKTFKVATAAAEKEYHFMQRTVGLNRLPDGTITSDQLDAEVMVWLNGGYLLKEVHYLGQHKGPGGEFLGNTFGYHFVKE